MDSHHQLRASEHRLGLRRSDNERESLSARVEGGLRAGVHAAEKGPALEVAVEVFSPASGFEKERGLLGWLTLQIGGSLVVQGVTLRRTKAGRLRLSFPGRRDSQGRMRPYVRPLDGRAREELEAVVFAALDPEDMA